MAATLRKWLHMSCGSGKSEKNNKNRGAIAENPGGGGGVPSPNRRCRCRQRQPHQRRLGCAAANAARRLVARARSAVSRVSPAANNVGGGGGGGPILAAPVSQPPPPTTTTTTKTRSNGGNNGKKSLDLSSRSIAHEKLVRTRRLMREFRELSTRQAAMSGTANLFTVELVDDNLYEWHVKLYGLDPESDLWRDLRDAGTSYVLLGITFPKNFPFAPPFMRVVSPRIEKGFVMEGGAICMELLTPAGWASAYTVEAIVMQFAASVVKGHGRVVRKIGKGVKGHHVDHVAPVKSNVGGSSSSSKTFSRKAAEASFRSLVKTHEKFGWVTPGLAEG